MTTNEARNQMTEANAGHTKAMGRYLRNEGDQKENEAKMEYWQGKRLEAIAVLYPNG